MSSAITAKATQQTLIHIIDSNEYASKFGEDKVPYPCNIRSQVGSTTESFNRMLSLLRGSPTSDRGQSARLIPSVASNLATPIKFLAKGKGFSYGSTGKRFKITYYSSQAAARLRGRSKQSTVVTYDLMSQTVQSIQRSGGRIEGIDEVT